MDHAGRRCLIEFMTHLPFPSSRSSSGLPEGTTGGRGFGPTSRGFQFPFKAFADRDRRLGRPFHVTVRQSLVRSATNEACRRFLHLHTYPGAVSSARRPTPSASPARTPRASCRPAAP